MTSAVGGNATEECMQAIPIWLPEAVSACPSYKASRDVGTAKAVDACLVQGAYEYAQSQCHANDGCVRNRLLLELVNVHDALNKCNLTKQPTPQNKTGDAMFVPASLPPPPPGCVARPGGCTVPPPQPSAIIAEKQKRDDRDQTYQFRPLDVQNCINGCETLELKCLSGCSFIRGSEVDQVSIFASCSVACHSYPGDVGASSNKQQCMRDCIDQHQQPASSQPASSQPTASQTNDSPTDVPSSTSTADDPSDTSTADDDACSDCWSDTEFGGGCPMHSWAPKVAENTSMLILAGLSFAVAAWL